MDEHSKYTETEYIIGFVFFFGTDVVCAVIDTTGVGAAIAPVIQMGGTFAQTLWAWGKGDKNAVKTGRQIAKYASNALPWVPTLTVMFLAEAYIHNHPERFATLQKLEGAASGKPSAAIKS